MKKYNNVSVIGYFIAMMQKLLVIWSKEFGHVDMIVN